MVGGIDVHVERHHAVDPVVADEGGDERVGCGHAVPTEGREPVGTEGGVDGGVDVGPHMEVVCHHAVAAPAVGEDDLEGGVVV